MDTFVGSLGGFVCAFLSFVYDLIYNHKYHMKAFSLHELDRVLKEEFLCEILCCILCMDILVFFPGEELSVLSN